ncbi:MAG: dTDP-4-dehydrorhamnose reductase [Armatimonadetes bacterium]|nr:dTDP-4-dehydrorhamnose reductase [Armatimonadota bacterium]
MKVIVLGGTGLLGTHLARIGAARGHDLINPSRAELDLRDYRSIQMIEAMDAAACINAVAYTQVDLAETEQDEAQYLNAQLPTMLGSACRRSGKRLVHYSTDFVFGVGFSSPIAEDATPCPMSVYGRTKLDGECGIAESGCDAAILRTSWLYGWPGASFPRSILNAARAGKALRVVDDQIGCPTYAPEVARQTWDFVEAWPDDGVYHVTGLDPMSWCGFARQVVGAFSAATGTHTPEITPITTSEWPTPAVRPGYSVLDCKKFGELGFAPPPPVQECVAEFVSHYLADL